MNHRRNPPSNRRKSIRLKGYDYTQSGAYFVTLVMRNRLSLLGEIVSGKMLLNGIGESIRDAWEWLAKRYPYVKLDEYVVMPNHFHGIIVLTNDRQPHHHSRPMNKPLGRLMAAFKTVSTKQTNLLQGTPGQPMWQRNFYEHVIRDETELDRIRKYIADNPANWETDSENPGASEEPGAQLT